LPARYKVSEDEAEEILFTQPQFRLSRLATEKV